MQTISSYIVNSKMVIKCDEKGCPIKQSKSSRRKLDTNENEAEMLYIKEMEKCKFSPDTSIANAWLCTNFDIKKPSHQLISSVATFFSMILHVNFPREAYRRRKGCLFWLEKNLPFILNACIKLDIVVINEKGTKIKLKNQLIKEKNSKKEVKHDMPDVTFDIMDIEEPQFDIDNFFIGDLTDML